MTVHSMLPAIEASLRSVGDRLRREQPAQGLADSAAMRDCHETLTRQASETLRTALARILPDIPLVTAGIAPSAERRPDPGAHWLHDPIDGGIQFLQGLPLWTTTLCLIDAGAPLLSLVYQPATGDLYHAGRGQGACRNGESLRVTARSDLAIAFLGTSFPNYPKRPRQEVESFLAHLSSTVPAIFAQRWMGPASLSLAQLAAGQLDGYWEVGSALYDWLPGALIAREAGAHLSDLRGGPFDWGCDGVLAASPAMHAALLDLLTARQASHFL